MTALTSVESHEPLMRRFALFEYGFRPFFLAAGMYALVVVPVWLYFFAHHAVPFGALPAMYWHAHELMYGFVVAAISGFMLTAVPSWTGARGFAGRPLIALVLLWVAGRVAMTTVAQVPFLLTALTELALLPALLVLLTPPLLRSQNHNTPLLFVLGALWLSDCGFVLALRLGDVVLADRAIRLAIDITLLLVTVIGGRIVPAFTGNALRKLGQNVAMVSRRWIEGTVIAAMAAIIVVDVITPDSVLSGILAAVAASAHAIRLSGWHSLKARSQPIVWVLHVAYAWLPIHKMAARLHHGHPCDDDSRSDDTRLARPHRSPARRTAIDRHCLHAAHSRDAGARVRRGRCTQSLSLGGVVRGAGLDAGVSHLRGCVRADTRGPPR